MKETGILMVDDMRDNALADLKTQTRRVIVPQPSLLATDAIKSADDKSKDYRDWKFLTRMYPNLASAVSPWIRCPYGRPGDRLYLKEDVYLSMAQHHGAPCVAAYYRVPYNDFTHRHFLLEDLSPEIVRKFEKKKTWGRWISKLLMYKFLARVWFEITDVRVQRVQDINADDARAEGIAEHCTGGCVPHCNSCNEIDRDTFRRLWDSINADRGFGWDVNPWVFAITFRRLKDV